VTHIGVIDYGMGNRRSVEKALEHVGATVSLTSDHQALKASDGLILPGVGAFPRAMRNLDALGLPGLIGELTGRGTPLLGICLGMQLLFDTSEEMGGAAGLGLIGGEVTRLEAGERRIPHIGWNEVRFERASPLAARPPDTGCPFYHVHSFAARPRDPGHVIATAEYGERFATIVGHDNVFGVQFHPEKSSQGGLRMLETFVGFCAGGEARVAA
jgi:imidazole glycerol-phosphate synthase subunit HisH